LSNHRGTVFHRAASLFNTLPMRFSSRVLLLVVAVLTRVAVAEAAAEPNPFTNDPNQAAERTCFQTSQSWSEAGNLRSDVAIAYGIGPNLPDRMDTWRQHGYRVHVMTGVSWGQYQDYLYGKFDGINHEDEAQTDRNGNKISHGGDVYYMCPGTNYGKFLSVGIQRALDAGAEAIHLEEPEFWVRAGYSEGFKREWQVYYGEAWQEPHSSVDAQWRASKLKYFLYRRALQQIFDHVQAYNRRTAKNVRCYVPTHSLLNYAQWGIVSPESSLAGLKGCDGYIAQVWTGTSRTPNMYRGQLRERTFETAFLEYGAMQNLVRATGRTVWYLNDPVEDNGNHDWNDYRQNWESTLVASLFQPEVWQFEVAPWPERVFHGRYPRRARPEARESIPSAYATELQTVMNALNDMKQPNIAWDCGTTGIGLLVSDSLMFERGEPVPTDAHLENVYGLALPLLKRGMPVAPIQLENVTIPHYLDGFRVLLLSYRGMKPLTPEVHEHLAQWVRKGGSLVVCDDDGDPYNKVREWWNSGSFHYATPREHLFEKLGLRLGMNTPAHSADGVLTQKVGKGSMLWLKADPARLSADGKGDVTVIAVARQAAEKAGLKWRETSYLWLRRGPYVIAAGLDETISESPKQLRGKFVNLFDPEFKLRDQITLTPGSRFFLLDLDSPAVASPGTILASACKALPQKTGKGAIAAMVEGVAKTPGVVLVRATTRPKAITLEGKPIETYDVVPEGNLLRIRFENESFPRKLEVQF
jgi:hypothetical protein